MFSDPIIAIKHHYGYINVRGGRAHFSGESVNVEVGRMMWGWMRSESQITEKRWSRAGDAGDGAAWEGVVVEVLT